MFAYEVDLGLIDGVHMDGRKDDGSDSSTESTPDDSDSRPTLNPGTKGDPPSEKRSGDGGQSDESGG